MEEHAIITCFYPNTHFSNCKLCYKFTFCLLSFRLPIYFQKNSLVHLPFPAVLASLRVKTFSSYEMTRNWIKKFLVIPFRYTTFIHLCNARGMNEIIFQLDFRRIFQKENFFFFFVKWWFGWIYLAFMWNIKLVSFNKSPFYLLVKNLFGRHG